MGKLSKEQADQLAELERLRDEPDDDPDDDDDGGVIVLRGSRADTFLDSLLSAGKKRKRTPAAGEGEGQGQGEGQGEGEGDGQGEGDGDGDAGKPGDKLPKGHRYFR